MRPVAGTDTGQGQKEHCKRWDAAATGTWAPAKR